MLRRRTPKPDYAEIDRLERELGLDDASKQRQIELARKKPEFKENGGVVDLAYAKTPIMALAAKTDEFLMAPGVRWPVENSNHVQFISASAYCGSPSRIVLPRGFVA